MIHRASKRAWVRKQSWDTEGVGDVDETRWRLRDVDLQNDLTVTNLPSLPSPTQVRGEAPSSLL